jgi:U6 snRNA-associated Sm-like protein LSm8
MAATLKELHDSKLLHSHGLVQLTAFSVCTQNRLTVAYLIFLAESVMVVTSDARIIVGTLVGHDQVQNLIMNDAQERVYSADEEVELVELGLYVIRGDNVCIIGEYDTDKLNDDQRIPHALPEINQHQN